MIVYGKSVLEQLSTKPEEIEEIYVLQSLKDQRVLKALARVDKSRIHYVNRSYLDRISDGGVHQGIAARVKDIPLLDLDTFIRKNPIESNPVIVALDGIQDPHNLGAILRTCDAIGVNGVLLPKNRSASLSPAAIKASTGAAYTVDIVSITNLAQALDELKSQGYWVVGTDFEGARDYREGVYNVPLVLVMGNEGKGISPNIKKHCDYKVKLPMKGSVQSLNVSVATAILLYEINRQREM